MAYCRAIRVMGLIIALLLFVAIDGEVMKGGGRRNLQDETRAVMVEVLAELKRSIKSDPLGVMDSWHVNVTHAVDPCNDKWMGLTCDEQGELIAINLSDQELRGTLTPSLSLLSLTSLSSLDLSHNNLSLSADVPDLSTLMPPSLTLLNLSYTIIGADRQLSHLLNLSTSSTHSHLSQLWLDDIQLSGSLPQQLTAIQMARIFPALSILSLSHNSLTGALSAAAQQLQPCQSLQRLDLSHNNLSGTLDNWCSSGGSNLSATLTYLDVSYNTLQGVIPAGLANCSALQHLDLAYNVGLWGTLPASLPLNLTFFSVVYCLSLSGSLPPQFALLSRLDSLLLEGNNFSGAPLPILLNCSALRTIHFFGNFFEGRIPSDFCTHLPNLQDLVLGNNSFSGPLPPSLANCSFTNLMLGINKFSGSISGEMLGKWTKLQRQLDLQKNSFTGSIPPQIGNLTKLEILILNNNDFSGSFPQEMGLLSSLHGATFEYNSFSGNFPGQIFNCTELQHLIIHHNSFGGPIPSSIGKALKLTYLEAHNNLLTGSLPYALANCTQLQNFSLGHNQFTGSIPQYLASTTNILFLFDLSHNNFSGAIPTGFGGLFQMQSLDLSHNKLSGPIPADLSLCVGLLSLNLASNSLEGNISSSLGDSQSLALTMLNLSFNSLSGSIPSSLGSLRSLQKLDLSYNALEGSIPVTLSTVPSLVFLNLSYNNLQGGVPKQGGVFDNATAASFLGNPGLCGDIVHRSCSHRRHSVLAGKATKIGLVVGASILALAIIIIALMTYRSRTQAHRRRPTSPKDYFKKLQLSQIQEATNNFNMKNLIGKGSSGSVYKGVMPDGQVLAFKRFTMESSSLHAFFRELQAVRQIRHRNLIKILGYWSNHKDNNILILEYMQNGSLEDHLHVMPKDQPRSCKLTWEVRWDIAVGVAEGLLYLHEDCLNAPVIHCDIKPSNILFDANMQVHISDFGLAKIVVDMVTTTQNLHGTLGYMAPECASFGQISSKCDVYSYGILMLELVSGIRPTDTVFLKEDVTLIEWSKSKIRAGLTHEILDEIIVSEYEERMHDAKMELLINVALECTRENPRDRPTMNQVLARLHDPIEKGSFDDKLQVLLTNQLSL